MADPDWEARLPVVGWSEPVLWLAASVCSEAGSSSSLWSDCGGEKEETASCFSCFGDCGGEKEETGSFFSSCDRRGVEEGASSIFSSVEAGGETEAGSSFSFFGDCGGEKEAGSSFFSSVECGGETEEAGFSMRGEVGEAGLDVNFELTSSFMFPFTRTRPSN